MELEEKQTILRKLVAGDGKYLREKSFQEEIINDNGVTQKVTPDYATIIFLAANASIEDYEELDMPSESFKQKLKEKNDEFNRIQLEKYEKEQEEKRKQEEEILESLDYEIMSEK